MPVVRRYQPAKISDKVEGRFPLRLVRLCLMDLWRMLDDPASLFGGGAPGTPGAPGAPGSAGGPASTLATRIQVQWKANGPYRVDTEVDGAWVVPTACEVATLKLWRGRAGTSGNTIIDLNRRPVGSAPGSEVSLYATQANRPTLAYYDPDGTLDCILPDTVSLAEGDIITVDCDSRDSGRPVDFSLTLEAA